MCWCKEFAKYHVCDPFNLGKKRLDHSSFPWTSIPPPHTWPIIMVSHRSPSPSSSPSPSPSPSPPAKSATIVSWSRHASPGELNTGQNSNLLGIIFLLPCSESPSQPLLSASQPKTYIQNSLNSTLEPVNHPPHHHHHHHHCHHCHHHHQHLDHCQ